MSLDLDKLGELISILQKAKYYGYSSKSSPVEYLLEAAIDISLLLANSFAEGRESIRVNPEIRFSEKHSDALGNPKQISFAKKKPIWIDPEAAKFLRKLASFFVVLKRRRSLSEALTSSELVVASKSDFRKRNPNPTQKTKVRTLAYKSKLKAKRTSRMAYYRRQRKKEMP
jgi:hypothetical protein